MRFLLIVICLFTSSCLIAGNSAVVPADKQGKIDRVMELSGMDELIESVPEMFAAGYELEAQDMGDPMPEEVLDVLKTATLKVFAAETLRTSVLDHVEQHYDESKLSETIKILESPISSRMLQLEKKANDPDIDTQISDFVATLEENPPSDERMVLLAKLDEVSHSSQIMKAAQMELMRNMLFAISAYNPETEPLSPDEVDSAISDVEADLNASIGQMTLLLNLFVYRDASDKEIEQYITLYEDENLQWFLGVWFGGLVKSIGDGGAELGKVLIRELATQEIAL